jgi:hypothetical protein
MLQNIKELCGRKLAATDGEIGHVKDFYFNDQDWTVRYVIADTGSWLPGRKVIISPHAFGGLQQTGNSLRVRLTRKQIEGSPSIESHKPVSRQYEEEYYKYYGWPCYWQGDGLWGMSGFPVVALPETPLSNKAATANGTKAERSDAHLRSTQAVIGYHLEATDGITGHICDFVMDSETWAIHALVIKTGHRFSGKEVQLPVSAVDRISYDASTVFVNVTKEVVERSASHQLDLVSAGK